MVDAVNSLPLQSTAPRSQPPAAPVTSSSESVQSSSPEFVSSNIRVDNLQNVAILEYRSSKTGEIVRQYPTQQQISAFKRAQHASVEAPKPEAHAPAAPEHTAQAAPAPAPSTPAPAAESTGGDTGTTSILA